VIHVRLYIIVKTVWLSTTSIRAYFSGELRALLWAKSSSLSLFVVDNDLVKTDFGHFICLPKWIPFSFNKYKKILSSSLLTAGCYIKTSDCPKIVIAKLFCQTQELQLIIPFILPSQRSAIITAGDTVGVLDLDVHRPTSHTQNVTWRVPRLQHCIR